MAGGIVAVAKVVLAADNSQLKKGLRDSKTEVKSWSEVSSKAYKGAQLAATAGLGLMVVGLKKSIDAAKDAEVSQKRMETQLKALGISWQTHGKHIDEVIQKQSRLAAFDDEELAESFTNLVRTTGDVNKALELNGLAADIARAKNISLEAASKLLQKAYNGSEGAATKLGIKVQGLNKDMSDQEKGLVIVNELQKKFAGQAKEYGDTAAGAQERFKVALENLQETIGQKLLPVVTRLAEKGTKAVEWIADNPGKVKAMALAFGGLAVALKGIKLANSVVGNLSTFVGLFSKLGSVRNASAAADAVSGIAVAGTRGGMLGKTAGILGRIAGVALGPWGLLAAAGVGGLAFAITKLGRSGPNKVERALDQLDQTTRRLAGSMRFADQAADRLVDSELAAERAALGVKQAQQAQTAASDELADARAALNKLEEKGVTTGPKLEAAKQRVTDAELMLEDATLAVTEAKRGQELAERDLGKAQDIATGSRRHANDVIRETVHDTLMLTGRTREMTSAFAGTWRQVYITKRELPGYIAQLRETATNQKTAGTTAGRFAGMMADLTEQLGRVPTDVETHYLLMGAQAGKKDLREITDLIKKVPRAVRVAFQAYLDYTGLNANQVAGGPTSSSRFAGGVVGAFAAGGEVPMGRGGLGRDSVLMWLKPGELVLNERQQAVFGGKGRLKRMLGFATGGQVPTPDAAPTYGTYWVGNRFVTHNPNARHFWNPDSDEFSTKNRAFANPPAGPHVGRLYGKAVPPIAFRFWQKWWGRKQWEQFLREGSRHGLGPGWARRFASDHPLASKLLWLNKHVPSGSRWPWEKPDPSSAGIPGGPMTAPVGTGSSYQRVVAALNFARAVAAKGYRYNYGGGHNGSFAPSGGESPPGYDCSGFVSAVLHQGSLMRGGPYTSSSFYPGGGAGMAAGPGKWVSVYTWGTSGRSGHVFMDILGNRMEAGRYGGGGGYAGARSTAGFRVSHPAGYAAGGMVGGRVPVMVKPGEMIVNAGPAMNARIARRLGFRGRATPGARLATGGGTVARIPEGDAATDAASSFSVDTASATYEPKLVEGKCFRWGKQYWGAAIGHGKAAFVKWAKEHGKTENWVNTVFKQNHPEFYKALTNASYTIPAGSRQNPLPGYGPPVDPDEELPGEEIEDPGGDVVDDAGGDDYGGGDYGGDSGGSSGPSEAETQAQIAEAIAREAASIWGARSRFMSEFAPNVFSPSAAGLQLGSSALPGKTSVTVIQNMPAPVEDPFVLARRAAIAAKGAF